MDSSMSPVLRQCNRTRCTPRRRLEPIPGQILINSIFSPRNKNLVEKDKSCNLDEEKDK